MEVIPTAQSLEFCRTQAVASEQACTPTPDPHPIPHRTPHLTIVPAWPRAAVLWPLCPCPPPCYPAPAQAAAEADEEGEVVPIGDYLREDIPEGIKSTYARALPNLLREGAGGGIFPDSGGIFP